MDGITYYHWLGREADHEAMVEQMRQRQQTLYAGGGRRVHTGAETSRATYVASHPARSRARIVP